MCMLCKGAGRPSTSSDSTGSRGASAGKNWQWKTYVIGMVDWKDLT